MRKGVMSAAMSLAMVATAVAQTQVYDLPNSKLHVYQTNDAMGDVSFIIEGDRSLVILEQPLFVENIKEFNAYIDQLGKPIDRVVANFHSLGLADYPQNKIVMPKAMIEFGESEMSQGMVAKFKGEFGEAADFRPHKKARGVDVPSLQRWAGVDLQLTAAMEGGFPAANILIDNTAFYMHFAPTRSHLAPMRVRSIESIDAMLKEATQVKASGAKYIFGSHGTSHASSQEDLDFYIDYLRAIKRLRGECETADLFTQRLIVEYPTLPNAEAVRVISKSLYPDEVVDEEREAVRARVQDYFDMVSNLDRDIAASLWATTGDVSIITPRSHFFGVESIMNDFLIKTFSSMRSRKLHSLSEMINIYGDSANVQLYWIFDTEDGVGEKHQTRGRETLLFEKIAGDWRLVHVHYSRLPQ